MIDIKKIQQQFASELSKATAPAALEELKIKYLGRKQGLIVNALAELVSLSVDQKRKLGPELNALRQNIEAALEEKLESLSSDASSVDVTMNGSKPALGHLHPLTQTQEELEDVFRGLGFSVVYGPEVETDWYNFTALNVPEHHPARDMQDTFYVEGKHKNQQLLLRTQTSAMQVRFMQQHKPPFAIIVPGRVFRNEATDITHEHTFLQMEGLVVGPDISYANMVWTLDHALKQFFGNEAKIKLLPSYFPFVEPGAEVALSHPKFHNGRWVEILGCGMVHQNVFEAAGYKRGELQGFAFGFGLTRFALMKYGITDIRLFAENNLQFLEQF